MRLATAALCLAACSAHAPAAVHPQTSQVSPRLASLLEDKCASCHDGDSDRPQLGADALPSSELAMRAALLVSAQRMPPPPAVLSSADRAALIDALCESGSHDVRRCEETYAPEETPAYAREPLELLYAIDQRAPSPMRTRTRLEVQYRGIFFNPGRVYRLDASLLVMGALLASERCDAQAEASTAAKHACVSSILDLDLMRVPRP